MSHPIGAFFNTHHGTTNAVCMPAVLTLNAPAIHKRFDQAASYLGLEGGFDGFCDFFSDLMISSIFLGLFQTLALIRRVLNTSSQWPLMIHPAAETLCR
jgi:hypothetical protein